MRFLVRNDFDLIRRIEAAFGPIRELNKRLAAQSVTAEHVVDLYGIALAKDPRAPERDDIEAHVMRLGVVRAVGPLLNLGLNLFAGNEKAAEWIKGEMDRHSFGDDDDILEGVPRPPRAA